MVKTIDPNSDTSKLLNYFSEFDEKIRGKFLTQTIWIEEEIDRIIGAHFGEGKKAKFDLFVGLILSELSFNAKIKIFLTLMNEHHKKVFQKYKKLESDLETTRKFRNMLAHAILDLKKSFIQKNKRDRIPLKYYKNGKAVNVELTEKEAVTKINLAGDVLFRLKDLEEDLIKSQKERV